MKCLSCNTENHSNAKFCSNCGKPLPTGNTHFEKELTSTSSQDVNSKQSPGSFMKAKRVYIVVSVMVLAVIGSVFFKTYSKSATYDSAVQKFENKNYAEAAELFSSLSDYKDSLTYVTECNYQLAIKNLEDGNYEEAIDVFTQLGEYESSEDYLEKAVFERKYAKFNLEIDVDSEIYRETALRTIEDAEAALSGGMYGEWYSSETNEKITVNRYQINNRDYGVNYVICLDGWHVVHFYYIDDPEHEHTLSAYYEFFEYIGESIDTLSIYSLHSEEEFLYRSISQDDYDNLVMLNAEAEASQPAYSNDEIVSRTFAAFKSKVKGQYSGPATLYHSADYSNAYVDYDWSTRTYACSMTGEYSTNAFDFFGTSTSTYFVTAEFVDTGSGLTMTSFSVS